jgi:hypothetical protein
VGEGAAPTREGDKPSDVTLRRGVSQWACEEYEATHGGSYEASTADESVYEAFKRGSYRLRGGRPPKPEHESEVHGRLGA